MEGGQKQSSFDGLGNHVYLEKQDQLRDLGVDISTSQIVVVGSQSSGKSSLLENLTGFAFPRGQGLCTRYATQITLRRHSVKSIVISITPRHDADVELKEKLREFHRELDDFDGRTLGKVIEEANTAMGIRSGPMKDDQSLPVFSEDILKVEISGPEHSHLTVIDVPGLFQVTDAGETTATDKTMVENMVRRYMKDERTIILAVLSALADRATETILQLAKEADPNEERTLGILTKADLVREDAVRRTILGVVKGPTLKLGYFVVCNRGADDDNIEIEQCRQKEKDFFSQPEWRDLVNTNRTGVATLKLQLQVLLTDLAKREFPKQRAEVAKRLADCRKKVDAMGKPRGDAYGQRQCLTGFASKFERIVRDALEGRYDGDPIFSERPELKLITKVLDLNEGFSEIMWKMGHTRPFMEKPPPTETLDGEQPPSKSNNSALSRTQVSKADHTKYEKIIDGIHSDGVSLVELRDIIVEEEFVCPAPSTSIPIMQHIDECYRSSRGPELGTFGGALLATIFREQTINWPYIVISHVEAIIGIVHAFIKDVLEFIVLDKRIREELWHLALIGRLSTAYKNALKQAKFLLDIERNMRPSTYNHYYSDNLQKARANRDIVSKDNAEQVKEDLHDSLRSYYKVSRKRFVDVICRQVIEHHLLIGEDSPLKILTPQFVASMSEENLGMIAGEDALTKRERQRLETEIAGLEEATKSIFRS